MTTWRQRLSPRWRARLVDLEQFDWREAIESGPYAVIGAAIVIGLFAFALMS